MPVYSILLIVHITGGSVALASATAAITSKLLDTAHRWHKVSGKVYFWAMTTVFVTALPMTFLKPNLFLLLIALFSYYMTFTGWRYATNRRGTPQALEWALVGIMLLTALGMLIYGLSLLARDDSNGVTLMVFGGIGAALSSSNAMIYRRGGAKGKERIAQHLGSMMGATIATLTAFLVTNFSTNPAFILWLAPAVMLAPVITFWSIRLRAGFRPKGFVG